METFKSLLELQPMAANKILQVEKISKYGKELLMSLLEEVISSLQECI